MCAVYAGRFVQHAHILVAEGHSRLDPAALAGEEEEDISGRIVDAARAWQNESSAQDWVKTYFINAEDPVEWATRQGQVRKGKARPRIDIRVESSESIPRPTFTFEAKRFYPRSGASDYLGGKGLGTFLDGTKARGQLAAGMLGYVQHGAIPDTVQKIERGLNAERKAYGLDPAAPVWLLIVHDIRIACSYVSYHARHENLPDLAVHHSFLPCSASACIQPIR